MKAFIVAIASVVALLIVVSAGESDVTEMVCIPGQPYMEDCNQCFCNGDGSAGVCTRMGCPQYPICTDGKMMINENSDICICRKGVLFCYPQPNRNN